ncbi:MAG TPA: hybrid sensor histidine kinase/response regulator, partial [Anaerolineae bacterium]|nr:hybrid sensor histidine kinase/response regulator [Anaerolineae bacterium]
MNQKTLHILLVEDNDDHAELIRRAFETENYPATISHAPNLAEAYHLQQTTQPDLLIVDFLLPDGHGTELLPKHLEDRTLPVIIMTSHGDEQIAVEAIKAGALDYIVKTPMSLLEMPAFVERAMREWGHILEWRQEKENAAWFSRILDKTHNEIFVFDAQTWQFILVNQVGQENLGYAMAELRHMTCLKICPDHTAESFAELLAPLQNGQEESIQYTTSHQRRDGSVYPVEVYLQLSQFQATPVYVAIVLDISERLKREEQMRQQDRLAAVGQLASGIAHDFNNIMAVIILYTQIVERSSDLSEKDRKRLQTVVEQASRAAELIEQILDFSRSSVLERHIIELAPFLKELIKLMQRTLPENIRIAFQNDATTCKVNADTTRIQQMMVNLMLNARDAMPDGGNLTVTLRTETFQPGDTLPATEMEHGRWAHIIVSDNGSGIAEEVQPHIFEPFFTTKHRGRGTGLGLAQVYGIVKQHDGAIQVDSRPEEGAAFHIYLPLQTPAETFTNISIDTTELVTGNKEAILLVEDDEATQNALAHSLELLNYRLILARNGKEALQLYEQNRPQIDLIISDMVMPE